MQGGALEYSAGVLEHYILAMLPTKSFTLLPRTRFHPVSAVWCSARLNVPFQPCTYDSLDRGSCPAIAVLAGTIWTSLQPLQESYRRFFSLWPHQGIV